MSLTVNQGGSSNKQYEQIPKGVHLARCYSIVDLGHQTIEWKGEVKVVPKVRITWEINELMADGRPFVISKEYTASIGPKANLRKDLDAWRGRDFTEEELANFSLENVLGAPCQISISHTSKGDKTYANVDAIIPLAKGMVAPELVNPKVKFDISTFDKEVFEKLPEFVRKKILMSKELEENGIPEVQEDENEPSDESVPF